MTEDQTANKAGWEVITFRVGSQEFCTEIMSVLEIRGWSPATEIPHAPDFVRGVINLRGTVLPVVDLAKRLGLPSSEPTARHAIIVAHAGTRIAGLLVDAVSDIVTVTEGTVQPPPDVASDLAKTFVTGVIVVDGKLISLLALDPILPAPEGRKAA
jgi:purine-binding chemotaxis protein CheW